MACARPSLRRGRRALPRVLAGAGRVEQRAMLQAQVPAWGQTFQALNDVVIGRALAGRPVYMDVTVDGQRLPGYRRDAVMRGPASAEGHTPLGVPPDLRGEGGTEVGPVPPLDRAGPRASHREPPPLRGAGGGPAHRHRRGGGGGPPP